LIAKYYLFSLKSTLLSPGTHTLGPSHTFNESGNTFERFPSQILSVLSGVDDKDDEDSWTGAAKLSRK